MLVKSVRLSVCCALGLAECQYCHRACLLIKAAYVPYGQVGFILMQSRTCIESVTLALAARCWSEAGFLVPLGH